MINSISDVIHSFIHSFSHSIYESINKALLWLLGEKHGVHKGWGFKKPTVTHQVSNTTSWGASSKMNLASLPSPSGSLPQQKVKLGPHEFSSLTEADAHCLPAQHSARKLTEQHMRYAFWGVTAYKLKTCWLSSLLVSMQDCMKTVPESKPSTIFLKVSK